MFKRKRPAKFYFCDNEFERTVGFFTVLPVMNEQFNVVLSMVRVVVEVVQELIWF